MYSSERGDVQLTVEPPPTALPETIIILRLARASVGWVVCTENLSGCVNKLRTSRPGWVCSFTSRVWGPASRIYGYLMSRVSASNDMQLTSIFNEGSASASRPAVTQAVVPPSTLGHAVSKPKRQ